MTMISAAQLVPGSIEPVLERRVTDAAVHRVTIAVGADVLSVFFEEPVWAGLFADRYADQLAGDRDSTVRHYVSSHPSGYVFWSPGEAPLFWTGEELEAASIAFLADATAIAALMNASATLVSFHAATVALHDAAAAIVGPSNAGKTTTALACGRAGLQIYSDERCVVDGKVVVPFARTINVRRDGWRRLQGATLAGSTDLPAGARPTTPGFSIRIADLFGQRPPATPELCAVFLISGLEGGGRVTPVTWIDAAPVLARSMNCRERGLERGARLVETLRGVTCYRLYLGSPDESAELIRATLSSLAALRAS